MASVYYSGNAVDTTTKDLLTGDLLNKIVKQEIDAKIFDDIFGIFTNKQLNTGMQIEEFEVANLQSTDFDPTGANTLAKANMDFAVLYHKINRRKTFKATISNAQVKMAMLSEQNMADVANAITAELWNSSSIEDFEAVKQLFKDIAGEQKKMVICDLNGNGGDMDALTKAIQTLATNMTLPSTLYNFAGFKKEFNKKEDLVLVIDSATRARLNVDSLAGAFNMDKKELVGNIIVIDSMPAITYTNEKATKGIEIDIGETNKIITYKPDSSASTTVSGSAVCMLLNKKAIKRDPVEREIEDQRNGAGRFTNYYLHATDLLSYSTLRNAVVLVD